MRIDLKPHEMTPDERLNEMAAILARGVLRLRKARKFGDNSSPENSSESGPNPLDVPAETRLSVTTG